MKATGKKIEPTEAITYFRTSTDDQKLGIDAQRTIADRLAAQIGLPIVRSWEEHESGGNNDRVLLDEALRYATRKNAVLVIAKLDRLSRDSQFLGEVKKSGVRILCGDLPELDGSASSSLHFGVMASFAQFERERIGERTREALAELKLKGVPLGASRPECRNLKDEDRKAGSVNSAKESIARAIDETAQETAIATKMKRAGSTLQEIADHLTHVERIPSRQGTAWNPTMVRRLLVRGGEIKKTS